MTGLKGISLLFFILSSWNIQLNGQGQLTVHDFLATAQYDENIKLTQAKLEFLHYYPHRYPWIEDVEFRTRTNEFLLSRQEYLLRISPNSPAQRKWQNQLHQSRQDLAEKELQLELTESLMDRYDLLLELMHLPKLAKWNATYKSLLEDKLMIARSKVNDANFDIKDIIDIEEEIIKTRLGQLDIKDKQAEVNQKIYQLTGSRAPLDIKSIQWIKVRDIDQWMQNGLNKNIKHPLSAWYERKLEALESEYRLEKAGAERLFDFVQARFEDDRNVDFNDKFSIAAGFRFPLHGSDKLDLLEIQLDQALEKEKKRTSSVNIGKRK